MLMILSELSHVRRLINNNYPNLFALVNICLVARLWINCSSSLLKICDFKIFKNHDGGLYPKLQRGQLQISGQLNNNTVNGAMSITINRVINIVIRILFVNKKRK